MFEAGCAPASFPAPPHAHVYCDRPPSPAGLRRGEGFAVFQSWGASPAPQTPCRVFRDGCPSGLPAIPHPKDA